MSAATTNKSVTWLGLVIAALGNFALSPDVQSTLGPKAGPIVSTIGTLIAVVGPSIFHKKDN